MQRIRWSAVTTGLRAATDTFKVFSFMPENFPGQRVRDEGHPEQADNHDRHGAARARTNRWRARRRTCGARRCGRDSLVDYMLFPRLFALAERAWHQAPWNPPTSAGTSLRYGDGKVDWHAEERLGQLCGEDAVPACELGRAGIMYRLAPPGARIVSDMLEANSEFPDRRSNIARRETVASLFGAGAGQRSRRAAHARL